MSQKRSSSATPGIENGKYRNKVQALSTQTLIREGGDLVLEFFLLI